LLPNGQWVGSLDNLEGTKGYWFVSNSAFDFTYNPPSPSAARDLGVEVVEVPDEFKYTQSTKQSFYFVESIESAEEGDWVLAYNGNQIVGARIWNGGMIDVPAMGDDGDLSTSGYCKSGDKVEFKLFKSLTGQMHDLYSDSEPWSDLSISFIDNLALDAGSIVEGFGLESVYPNPFNPSTTIEFYAEHDSDVNVSIYDLNGRLIETLLSSRINTGSHNIQWDASNHSSGIYIVQVQFEDSMHSSKIMLIK